MKLFNTITNIVLLIAVIYLLADKFSNDNTSGSKASMVSDTTAGLNIAYINTDSLIRNYDFHKELKAELEKEAKKLEEDLAQKSQVFQENVKVLRQQQGSMNQQELQQAQMELQQKQQQLMSYRDEKTKALAEREKRLNELIKDDMEVILDSLKKERNLDFILSYDPQSILLTANKKYNITDVVSERLNNKEHRSKSAAMDSIIK